MEGNIDEILKAGADIEFWVSDSERRTSKIGAELNVRGEDGFDRDEKLYWVKRGWGILIEMREKYPNSEYLKERIDKLKKTARENLPEEIYKDIYESGSQEEPAAQTSS